MNWRGCVLALAACGAGARAADLHYTGAWKIQSAAVAPWWREKTPPAAAGVKELVGQVVTITPQRIIGPRPVGCDSPRYAVKAYPADMLFQGMFGEMTRRRQAITARKPAARAGFQGSKTWSTLETGCELDFHFIDERTAAFALDNYIFKMVWQQ
jgi:hypothetical protein